MNNLLGKTITNPIIGDEVTFIETSHSTNGARTVADILLSPMAAGPPLHYHNAFVEKFEVLEGELNIQVGKNKNILKQGDAVEAEMNVLHTFWSESNKPSRFRVTLEPGHEGFENHLAISYGLTRDGHTNKKGIPKKFSHLAILVTLSDTNIPGFFTVIISLLKAKARTKRSRKIQQELIDKYC